MENSAIMGLEGKGEAAEIFKAAASAVSTFGVRASPEPGLSGAERALAKIDILIYSGRIFPHAE